MLHSLCYHDQYSQAIDFSWLQVSFAEGLLSIIYPPDRVEMKKSFELILILARA